MHENSLKLKNKLLQRKNGHRKVKVMMGKCPRLGQKIAVFLIWFVIFLNCKFRFNKRRMTCQKPGQKTVNLYLIKCSNSFTIKLQLQTG